MQMLLSPMNINPNVVACVQTKLFVQMIPKEIGDQYDLFMAPTQTNATLVGIVDKKDTGHLGSIGFIDPKEMTNLCKRLAIIHNERGEGMDVGEVRLELLCKSTEEMYILKCRPSKHIGLAKILNSWLFFGKQ